MDKVIIDAWERWRVREDDDAYEGRISLGPPNNVAAAYEREDQHTAVAGRSPSGRRSGSLNGQHIPPSIPPQHRHTEGGEGVNLQPASCVVTRGLSAATSGDGVAVRGGGGPSIIYQSDDLPPLPPPGEDDEDDDDVQPNLFASWEGVAWAAPSQTQVV
jgi:hypothetical protein